MAMCRVGCSGAPPANKHGRKARKEVVEIWVLEGWQRRRAEWSRRIGGLEHEKYLSGGKRDGEALNERQD